MQEQLHQLVFRHRDAQITWEVMFGLPLPFKWWFTGI
jgi:hypothetical protein